MSTTFNVPLILASNDGETKKERHPVSLYNTTSVNNQVSNFVKDIKRIGSVTILNDGTPLAIRPVKPYDVLAILEMRDRLSSRSRFYRYLRDYSPTPQDIERICQLPQQGVTLHLTVIGEQPPPQADKSASYLR